ADVSDPLQRKDWTLFVLGHRLLHTLIRAAAGYPMPAALAIAATRHPALKTSHESMRFPLR
ncbi:MAG: hypothetical protein ACI9MC_004127, partial [Kiritimatiellia bacterium]